jgi:hypothetical protein
MLNMNWEELNQAQAISFDLYHRVEKIAQPESFEPGSVQR